MMKKIFIIFALFSIIYNQEEEEPKFPKIGYYTCDDKSLVKTEKEKFTNFTDKALGHLAMNWKDLAKHGKDSCKTLRTSNDNNICCFLQLKYKLNDDNYKMAGCVEVPISYVYEEGDIETLIDDYKKNITRDFILRKKNGDSDTQFIYSFKSFEVKKVWIECSSSSILKVTGLLLLAFLF